jgi:hypothetical protein
MPLLPAGEYLRMSKTIEKYDDSASLLLEKSNGI